MNPSMPHIKNKVDKDYESIEARQKKNENDKPYQD